SLRSQQVENELRDLGCGWAVGKRCAQCSSGCEDGTTLVASRCENLASSRDRPKRSGRKNLTPSCAVEYCKCDRSLPKPFHRQCRRSHCPRQPDLGCFARSCGENARYQ